MCTFCLCQLLLYNVVLTNELMQSNMVYILHIASVVNALLIEALGSV